MINYNICQIFLFIHIFPFELIIFILLRIYFLSYFSLSTNIWELRVQIFRFATSVYWSLNIWQFLLFISRFLFDIIKIVRFFTNVVVDYLIYGTNYFQAIILDKDFLLIFSRCHTVSIILWEWWSLGIDLLLFSEIMISSFTLPLL